MTTELGFAFRAGLLLTVRMTRRFREGIPFDLTEHSLHRIRLRSPVGSTCMLNWPGVLSVMVLLGVGARQRWSNRSMRWNSSQCRLGLGHRSSLHPQSVPGAHWTREPRLMIHSDLGLSQLQCRLEGPVPPAETSVTGTTVALPDSVTIVMLPVWIPAFKAAGNGVTVRTAGVDSPGLRNGQPVTGRICEGIEDRGAGNAWRVLSRIKSGESPPMSRRRSNWTD